MSEPQPADVVLIADPLAVAELARELRDEPIVAVDTESNSFHAYRERVCLIQISTPRRDVIVDPIAVDVGPLGAVLCDGRETVLHGADYDVRCLHRDYGWRLPRLFDTMIAARRLGRPQLGLAALVEARFGVRLSKSGQRSDWGRRPLTRAQLAYAALDTHYLLPLAAELRAELGERGLADQAAADFRRTARAESRPRVFDEEGWRRLGGARELDRSGQAVLRALWIAREARAQAEDRPPFKVLGEPSMVEIARRRPGSPEALAAVPGVSPQVLRRMGEAIRAALSAA